MARLYAMTISKINAKKLRIVTMLFEGSSPSQIVAETGCALQRVTRYAKFFGVRVSHETEKLVVSLIKRGLTEKEIVRRTKLTRKTVRAYASRLGLKLPKYGDKVTKLILSGVPAHEIPDKTGVSFMSVRRRCYQLGVPASPAPRKESVADIVKPLLEEGLTVEEIIEKTGLERGVIRKHARAMKITVAPTKFPDGHFPPREIAKKLGIRPKYINMFLQDYFIPYLRLAHPFVEQKVYNLAASVEALNKKKQQESERRFADRLFGR